jgi:Tol biopolymer transport system component
MHPWSVAGQDILYVAARNGTTTVNIWRIAKSGASWTVEPQLVGPFEKTHPVVSEDELVMYFARNETGKRKVFYVTRPSASSPWSSALEMQGMVNLQDFDDEPSWLSPDQCTLIFTSNRAGAPRAYQIVREHQ